MSTIETALQNSKEPTKTIGAILIEFYSTMKDLENDPERGDKQAVKIAMTISDIVEHFLKTLQYG